MPARAVQTQGNFQGGEWDQSSQGRLDHPWHKFALAWCENALPLENGVWAKRSGTQFIAPTYKRLAGVVRTFQANSDHRYAVALTTDGSTGWAHFFKNDAVLTDGDATITDASVSAGVVSVTTSAATGWAVNDHCTITGLGFQGAAFQNRWFAISTISGTSITLKDDQGTAFAFADPSGNPLGGATLHRVVRATTGFLGTLDAARIVNLGVMTYGGPLRALLLHQLYAPQTVSLTEGATDTIALAATDFVDGPYLDAQPGGGTVTGYSGSITFTPSDGTTFVAGDVSRHIRLYSEPAAWSSSTAYTNGQSVTYNSQWWYWVGGTVYAGVTGVVPGTLYTSSGGAQVLLWAPLPTAGQWAWGKITAQAGTSCTVSLTTNLNSANGSTVTKWRLGTFTAGVYPSCGILYEDRLWLAGCREGQINVSMSGQYLTFSPTDAYGNVFDNHAISAQLTSDSRDQIVWMRPDRSGLLLGTLADEITVTGGGAPLTPTNFQFRRMSRYGSFAGRSAVTAGFSTIFVQNTGMILYEYVTDAFTTAPSGRVLNEFSRETLGQSYLLDLAYTEAPTPVVWCAAAGGQLYACTYRRFSRFMSSPPDMAGWSRQRIGDQKRDVSSITAVSLNGQFHDLLYLITAPDPNGGAGIANQIEILRAPAASEFQT